MQTTPAARAAQPAQPQVDVVRGDDVDGVALRLAGEAVARHGGAEHVDVVELRVVARPQVIDGHAVGVGIELPVDGMELPGEGASVRAGARPSLDGPPEDVGVRGEANRRPAGGNDPQVAAVDGDAVARARAVLPLAGNPADLVGLLPGPPGLVDLVLGGLRLWGAGAGGRGEGG